MQGRATSWALAITLVAALAGCASTRPQFSTGLAGAGAGRTASSVPPPPKPAAPLDRGSDLEALLQQSALDTQRALEELKAGTVAQGVAAGSPGAASSTPPPGAPPAPVEVPLRAVPANTRDNPPPRPLLASPEPVASPAIPPAASLPSPTTETREALTQRLAAALGEHAGTATDPWPDLLALAALDPAALADHAAANKDLTEGQRRALLALPALLAAIPPDADPARVLAERAAALADQLADQRPLAVRAELCRRVVGLGSYTAFGVNRFPAGIEQRAIVYVEVADLPQRELGPMDSSLARQPGDRYLVDLTQETNLYNESGSLLALHVPEQRLTETSRNRRRDFFLVSRVTLPPSLSIGLYNLKVTVRDRATGAQAEASIPIEIVAGGR